MKNFTYQNGVLKSPNHKKSITFDLRYKKTNQAKPLIIFIHGFKGFKDWGPFDLLADFFSQKDFIFCKMNLSHNGTTPEKPFDFDDLEAFGNNNFSIELDDIGVMLDYFYSDESTVPDEEIEMRSVFLLGHSRGGGMALLKTYEDTRIKAVATLAAISDLKERWTAEYLQEWKEKGIQYVYNGRTKQHMPLYYQMVEDLNKNFERLNIPHAVKNLNKPILAIHGTNDETLPVSMAYDIKEWNPAVELFIIEEAGHTFDGYHPYDKDGLPKDLLLAAEKVNSFFKAII